MRLIIKRWYEPAPPGKQYHSPYRASAVLELTEDEKAVVRKYELGKHVVIQSKYSLTTIDDLIGGHNEFLSDVDIAMRNEQVLRDSCAGLPAMFEYCRTFGGEQIEIDY
jgi:hypothetical protein